jgi:periplasmic protein TonB
MNVGGVVAVCSLLLAQASGLNPPKTVTKTAPLRVFREDTPGLQKPFAVQHPYLSYTPEDLQAGVQGKIALEVTIGSDGRVRDAMVTDGTTLPATMEGRAIAVLSGWQFEPGTLNGQAVAVRMTVTFMMSTR